MNVAFIPVRGGSKSIPLKNIKEINGKPLVYWTVRAACDCKYIDTVYVATDSEAIKNVVESFGFSKVKVIGRSEESSSDTASTESAMLEFADSYKFENIVLVQATSPLLTGEDLDRGFEVFFQPETDSVLSAVKQKRFQWSIKADGNATATNYDVFARPRRQDYEGYFVENGAFYITRRLDLIKHKNRISGNIKIVEMNEDTFFEIDEPSDWIVIEALMKKKDLPKDKDSICKFSYDIKMFLTDCDGCLTDGGMYYSENGDELKKFNTRDGKGFELLRNAGIVVGIVTSEDVQLVRNRAKKMRLDIVECGVTDKLKLVKKLAQQYGIGLEQIVYLGDDVNDLEVIQQVGFGCSVADGMPQVKSAAKYITHVRGGEGAIREITERILNHEF